MRCFITDHAYLRAKERCGLSKKALTRIAQKALKGGMVFDELKGEVRNYIKRTVIARDPGHMPRIRVYGQFIFIFDKEALVTIFGVAKSMKRKMLNLWDSHKKYLEEKGK